MGKVMSYAQPNLAVVIKFVCGTDGNLGLNMNIVKQTPLYNDLVLLFLCLVKFKYHLWIYRTKNQKGYLKQHPW